eukprot:8654499-Lingulodinium_polyedra.AAC.1
MQTADAWACAGLPAHVLELLGRAITGGDWAQTAQGVERPRRCSIKTKVIPQQRLNKWKTAMAHNPFGPSS